MNHYSGKALHEARRQDLMNEAKGGWLLKQAREAEPASGRRNLIQQVWPALAVVIALAIGVLAR